MNPIGIAEDISIFDKEDSFPLLKALTNAVEKIPWKNKIVLFLFHCGEVTLPEIAEILGITKRKIHQIYAISFWT